MRISSFGNAVKDRILTFVPVVSAAGKQTLFLPLEADVSVIDITFKVTTVFTGTAVVLNVGRIVSGTLTASYFGNITLTSAALGAVVQLNASNLLKKVLTSGQTLMLTVTTAGGNTGRGSLAVRLRPQDGQVRSTGLRTAAAGF